MSTSKFEFAELEKILRRSEHDPAVESFFGELLANIERDEYYGWLEFKPEGLDVVFNEAPWVLPSKEITDPKELYLAAFHMHREGHEGYAGYSGKLPNEVALNDMEAELFRKMGHPVKSGGGGWSEARKVPIPRWFRYAFGDAILHFQLDPDGRVELATLQTPDVK